MKCFLLYLILREQGGIRFAQPDRIILPSPIPIGGQEAAAVWLF